LRGGDVTDAVSLFAGGESEPDEEVRLAGAGVAEQNDRVAGFEVVAARERRDGRRVDGGCGVEIEVGESFDAGEACFVDPSLAAPFGALVDFSGEDLGEEREIGELRSLRIGRDPFGVDALDEELQHGGLAIAANVAAKTTTD